MLSGGLRPADTGVGGRVTMRGDRMSGRGRDDELSRASSEIDSRWWCCALGGSDRRLSSDGRAGGVLRLEEDPGRDELDVCFWRCFGDRIDGSMGGERIISGALFGVWLVTVSSALVAVAMLVPLEALVTSFVRRDLVEVGVTVCDRVGFLGGSFCSVSDKPPVAVDSPGGGGLRA